MNRRLTLRARLAALTGLAVAVAVAACAVGCWFVVRGRLTEQLDKSLSQGPPDHRQPSNDCPHAPPDDDYRYPDPPTIQVIGQLRVQCTSEGRSPINVTEADYAVARGDRQDVHRNGTTADGTSVRVYTRPGRPATGSAIMAARSLTPINNSLNSLALLLVAVSAVGVVGAATAGLVVARAALAPVDRLTDAVEHIARTEDLDTTIPADGNDEIARLSASFNSMTSALAGSRMRQQRLIADAGHELRTPLTSLRTNIDLLLRSETTGRPLPDDGKRTLLTNVKAQLLELSDLVTDLLELARKDDRGEVSRVALHEVVDRGVERARLRGPHLDIVVSTEPSYVRGDAAALERAVVNLLDNAVKFSPPDGTVTVRLTDGELTVRDQGPGVAEEDLPYVFDRFWRSPSARGLPGSGLGLAIVARVVGETGGQVRLEAAEGGGTLARVTFVTTD